MKTLDKDLLMGIRKKNEDSFKMLYDKYSDITLRQISSRIADKDAVKDLFQDFWLYVWTSADLLRIDEKGEASKSLFFILSKRILDYYRNAAKNITENLDSIENLAGENLLYSHVVENILEKEVFDLVDQLIDNMPEIDQLIFDYRIRKQYSIKETASELALSEKTIQNRMTKISGELRKKLASNKVREDILYGLMLLLYFRS